MRIGFRCAVIFLMVISQISISPTKASRSASEPVGTQASDITRLVAESKPKTKLRWTRFRGTAEDKGQNYVLKASTKNGGVIEIAKEGVKVTGKQVQVQIGATARIIEEPKKPLVSQAKTPGRTADCHRKENCTSKCSACIGLLEVCCGDGTVKNGCIGAWGCP